MRTPNAWRLLECILFCLGVRCIISGCKPKPLVIHRRQRTVSEDDNVANSCRKYRQLVIWSITWFCYVQGAGNRFSAQIGHWHSKAVRVELLISRTPVIYIPRLAGDTRSRRFLESAPTVGTTYTGCWNENSGIEGRRRPLPLVSSLALAVKMSIETTESSSYSRNAWQTLSRGFTIWQLVD